MKEKETPSKIRSQILELGGEQKAFAARNYSSFGPTAPDRRPEEVIEAWNDLPPYLRNQIRGYAQGMRAYGFSTYHGRPVNEDALDVRKSIPEFDKLDEMYGEKSSEQSVEITTSRKI